MSQAILPLPEPIEAFFGRTDLADRVDLAALRAALEAHAIACSKAGAQQMRQLCAQAALDEQVDAQATGDEADLAYNQACEDCALAIGEVRI